MLALSISDDLALFAPFITPAFAAIFFCMTENKENSFSSKIFSVFAILGFAALILIGAWSAYQVVKFAPRLWGGEVLQLPSLSRTPKITITLDASELTANEPIDLTWDASGKLENGVFSFAYACREGLRIDVQYTTAEGEESFRALPCNAAYSLPNEDRALTMIPVTTERFIDGALALTFTDDNGESVRDTKSITVVNESAAETPAEDTTDTAKNTDTNTTTDTSDAAKEGTVATREPIKEGMVSYGDTATKTVTKTTTRTITVPVYPKNDPYGTPDLAAAIVSIDGGYGYNRGTATFRVTNNGTKESGVWNFIAQLPTYAGYTFTSQPQASILPGGHTDVTVSFDQAAYGAQFAVQVDPQGAVYETNEYNNYASSLVY